MFAQLRTLRDRAAQFQIVILDPPKFAPSAAQVKNAARAYKDINLLALKLLAPGGLLATFSCSGGGLGGAVPVDRRRRRARRRRRRQDRRALRRRRRPPRRARIPGRGIPERAAGGEVLTPKSGTDHVFVRQRYGQIVR